MEVAALRIGAEPSQWGELGFEVRAEGDVLVGGVRLELLPSAERGAIVSWALDGSQVPDSVDGLPTEAGVRHEDEARHPNGVLAIDHVVVITSSLERTTAALAEIGIDCRRVRDAGGGVRQGFFLVGDLLLEVVDGTELPEAAPARFWGVTMVVSDIEAAGALLGERLGRIKDAV